MLKFTALFVIMIFAFVVLNYLPISGGIEQDFNLLDAASTSSADEISVGWEENEITPIDNVNLEEDDEYDLNKVTTYKVDEFDEKVNQIPVSKPTEGNLPPKDIHDPTFLYEISPGVNLAGAEFAPHDQNYQHIYPTESLDYYSQKRVQLVRLPFLWERMQPTLNSPLDPAEIALMTTFLDKAEELNVYVILDLHNYDRYNGDVVGTQNVPTSSLSDFWKRMVTQFGEHQAVVAYGLMNEPHDTGSTWRDVAQEVVDEVRTVDPDTLLLVSGDHWSGAYSWPSVNDNMLLNDPSDKIVYEAHVYFDAWNVGAYNCTYDTCGVTPNLVSERIDPFITWLDDNDAYGFIGEYGVPSDDQRWIDLMGEFYDKLDQNQIGSTIWAGGPNWGGYVLSVEPERSNGEVVSEKLQMKYLENHLVNCENLGNGISPQCIVRIK